MGDGIKMHLTRTNGLSIPSMYIQMYSPDAMYIVLQVLPATMALSGEEPKSFLTGCRKKRKESAMTKTEVQENRKQMPEKKFYLFGSPSARELTEDAGRMVRKICRAGYPIVIGDGKSGADRLFRSCLLDSHYQRVTVYSVMQTPRTRKVPSWNSVRIVPDPGIRNGQARQAVKDRAMAETASWGLGIFDPFEVTKKGRLRVSAGPLRDAAQLLLERKGVYFFYRYEGQYKKAALRSMRDLQEIVASYELEHLSADEEAAVRKEAKDLSFESPSQMRSDLIRQRLRDLVLGEMTHQAGF